MDEPTPAQAQHGRRETPRSGASGEADALYPDRLTPGRMGGSCCERLALPGPGVVRPADDGASSAETGGTLNAPNVRLYLLAKALKPLAWRIRAQLAHERTMRELAVSVRDLERAA